MKIRITFKNNVTDKFIKGKKADPMELAHVKNIQFLRKSLFINFNHKEGYEIKLKYIDKIEEVREWEVEDAVF